MIELLIERLHLGTLSAALEILTSMITPALLLSACGTFILSTSNRLNHVVDRVRTLAQTYEGESKENASPSMHQDYRRYLSSHLNKLTTRATLLQNALTMLYLAAGVFVATSVAIGFLSIAGRGLAWLPVMLGIIGATFMLGAAIILIREAWLAVHLLREETGRLLELIHRGSK